MEYKAIELLDIDAKLLNEYFSEGWEYVDGFSQSIATGSNYSKTGNILIILKRTEVSL